LNICTKQLYYVANITFRILVKIIHTAAGHVDDPIHTAAGHVDDTWMSKNLMDKLL